MVPPRFVFQRFSLFRYDERAGSLLIADIIEVANALFKLRLIHSPRGSLLRRLWLPG